MLTNQAVSSANCLLRSLPQLDRDRLVARSESVELIFAEVLYRTGDAIPHVYFPTGGFISLVTPVSADTGVEVGLIGSEGVLGITLMLGIEIAPFQARVQGAGTALRINTALFLRELQQSLALQQILKRYLYVSMRQLAQTVACNRYHLVEARLARWLLMTHDRAEADTFHVTHVFLAYILGVRRVGITKAAHSLQQQKLISYRRGDITILDRIGLEAVACVCYQIDKETYRSTLA
ncbi:MAG: Crp/Fnr family transcriptional regulator [Methylomonas sp.]|uniref:Crp/Fnr family transcriptional regulator n=1 Tax=Methylomonas sp. TaxID=418 RepID=UPI0025DC1CCC|nr:Crp/Fnr family transcriptional regulator [Methylomonas sp.]MCK9605105.1 Crp/Fnr family transcriptional regulator [Methylomonas sp.]